MSDQFYMTLPSTSSSNFFPHNTTANYITQLRNPIQLQGAWEVCLYELHYPQTFFNVTKSSSKIKASYGINEEDTTITYMEPGYYRSSTDFLNSLNDTLFNLNLGSFVLNRSTWGSQYTPPETIGERTLKHLIPCATLSKQLGYEPGTNVIEAPLSSNPLNLARGIPTHMYVYCDIIEGQIVGDTCVPLLRMINTRHEKYSFGEDTTVSFQTPQYLPILKRSFGTIEIDLRENSGLPTPFKDGTLSVVLHFRKCSH